MKTSVSITFIAIGIAGIFMSWLFAVLSIDSRIEFWYFMFSLISGIGGIGSMAAGVSLLVE